MTVKHRLQVDSSLSDCNPTRHIRFVEAYARVFVIASRLFDHIDVIEIVDSSFMTNFDTYRPIRVGPDSRIQPINSLVEHPTNKDTLLIGGYRWMALLSIRTVS